MKKFSELNISMPYDNNMFNVPQIQIGNIINCEIAILDFQKDVTTKHGGGRYVVKIKHEGVQKKFFTNSGRIKTALDCSKDAIPFLATIKQECFKDGSKTYYFI
jgi:hypothetical protein